MKKIDLSALQGLSQNANPSGEIIGGGQNCFGIFCGNTCFGLICC